MGITPLVSFFSLADKSSPESVEVESKVCFYHGDNFKGTSVCYSGEQSIADVGSKHRDSFTSVRLYGKAAVRVYESKNYSGDQTIIMMDSYKFDKLNDNIDSFKLFTRKENDFACLFEHKGYRGTPICVEAGEYSSNLDGNIGRNKASSIMTAGNVRVDVYEDRGFQKEKWSYTHSEGLLSGSANDNADSFKVIKITPNEYQQRLLAQRDISDRVPLQKSYMQGTHNSYNSEDYRSLPWILGTTAVGPNHTISIHEQLQMGGRFIELDLNRVYGQIYACHSIDCYNYSTLVELPRLIAEINNYLKGNKKNDFVMLFIENHLEKQEDYDLVKKELERGLGDFIYRPEVSESKPCQNAPYNLSINDIVATGKKVFVLGAKCNGMSKSSGLNSWAFANVHSSRDADDSSVAMTPYNTDLLSESFMRVYECDHLLCTKRIAGNEIANTMQAGANVITMDRIRWHDTQTIIGSDERMVKQLWSWREGEYTQPVSQLNVAKVSARTSPLEASFIAASSDEQLPYACMMPGGNWVVTTAVGEFKGGTQACLDIGGTFDLPTTPREARFLHDALADYSEAFINYGTVHGKRTVGAANKISDRKTLPQL